MIEQALGCGGATVQWLAAGLTAAGVARNFVADLSLFALLTSFRAGHRSCCSVIRVLHVFCGGTCRALNLGALNRAWQGNNRRNDTGLLHVDRGERLGKRVMASHSGFAGWAVGNGRCYKPRSRGELWGRGIQRRTLEVIRDCQENAYNNDSLVVSIPLSYAPTESSPVQAAYCHHGSKSGSLQSFSRSYLLSPGHPNVVYSSHHHHHLIPWALQRSVKGSVSSEVCLVEDTQGRDILPAWPTTQRICLQLSSGSREYPAREFHPG